MAGGTFDPLVQKIRPGNYINIVSSRTDTVLTGKSGTTVVPLINHNYGPLGQFIKLTTGTADAEIKEIFGYSLAEPELLLVREAFKRASTVYVYVIAGESVKATATGGGVTATAKYGGTRGNDLRYIITANPIGGYDVTVYLDTSKVSGYTGLKNAAELVAVDDPYITFTAEDAAELAAVASVALKGGTDSAATMDAHTAFIDGIEMIPCSSAAYPITGDDAQNLKEAMKAKVLYLVNSCGRRIHVAMPDFAADSQFIINVTNGVVLSDGTAVDNAKACAWVAAAYAGASDTESLTYEEYGGAIDVLGRKKNEEAGAAIKAGEFFFSYSEEGKVIVEYDINSLVTLEEGVDSSYRKNRVQRVFDSLCSNIYTNYPPGKYDNEDVGWNLMDGVGAGILKGMQKAGSIKNVDTATDFMVDRTASKDDYTYFDVYVQPVDSSEKLYYKIKTS